jgi:hypothetical protein
MVFRKDVLADEAQFVAVRGMIVVAMCRVSVIPVRMIPVTAKGVTTHIRYSFRSESASGRLVFVCGCS